MCGVSVSPVLLPWLVPFGSKARVKRRLIRKTSGGEGALATGEVAPPMRPSAVIGAMALVDGRPPVFTEGGGIRAVLWLETRVLEGADR